MYTINLRFDKSLPAYPREGQLYRRPNKSSKLINIDYMLTKSLDATFKIIDSSLCGNSEKELEYLVNLINNNEVEFQMLDLDLRGLWITFDKAYKAINPNDKPKVHIDNIGDYIKACNDNNLIISQTNKANLDLFNICLVFKLPQPIHPGLNGLNTIAIYCDLELDSKNTLQPRQIIPSLLIKRVELLELNRQLDNSRSFKVIINQESTTEPEPAFYSDLCLLIPIVSFKKNDTTSLLREYLNYDNWTRFIFAIRDYYNDKQSNSSKDSQILYYLGNDTSYGMDDSIHCYLLQLKGNANIGMTKNAKYFLINRNDESSNYRIHITELKSDANQDLIDQLQTRINKLENDNNEFQNKNTNNKATIETLTTKFNQLNELISKQTDDLAKLEQDLIYHQDEIDSQSQNINDLKETIEDLKQRQKVISKDKTLDDEQRNEELRKIQQQIDTNEIEIKEINQTSKELISKIKDLTKATDIQKNEIKKTNLEIENNNSRINSLKKEINTNLKQIDVNQKVVEQYNKQIEFINADKYNVFDFTFNFEEEQNHTFSPLQLVNSALSDDFKTANNFYIDEKDSGTIAILNRYANGLEQIRLGYYKNPYLFANLLSPQNLRVEGDKAIDKQILNNYQLNQNQESAVYKGINIDNFFYLQGPPGTGKTQTICAIANQYALENKTILMTSQSHEAINNFFDRLDELNNDNPLLIMIKYIADEQKNEANKYNIDNAWKRFVTKCINACDPNSNSNDHLLKIVDELITNHFVMPPFITDSEAKIINENHELVKKLATLGRFAKYQKIINSIVDEINQDPIVFADAIIRILGKKAYDGNKELLDQYDNLIDQLHKLRSLPKVFDTLDEIKQYLNDQNTNHYASLFRKKYLNDENKLKNSQKFKDYIVNNHLINIFGITTTSTITLSLLNKNDTDLFYDWPIDIVIIDEISKSTTPEILSRIVLAKKVIFAGDYKQLPPKCDFTKDECIDLVQNKKFTSQFNKTMGDKTLEKVYDENGNKQEEAKHLADWLKKLYKDSFFNKEVKTLRSLPNRDNAPYQNLTVQHRFCNEIMNVVNTFYEDDEKLQMPEQPRKFPTYSFSLTYHNGNTQQCNEPVILIDSSKLSGQMQTYFKKTYHIKMDTNDSFDTNTWNNNQYGSRINPYDALIITNVIDNLHNSNPKLKLSDIGLITMTKSQKNLIRSFLKKINPSYNQIKIDTVDNFQGREAEVIILDFVPAYANLKNNNVNLHKRDLSFYLVNERNNVAISRAKAKLIMVGSFKGHYFVDSTISDVGSMKEEQEFLRCVYNECINNGCILDGEEFVWLKN